MSVVTTASNTMTSHLKTKHFILFLVLLLSAPIPYAHAVNVNKHKPRVTVVNMTRLDAFVSLYGDKCPGAIYNTLGHMCRTYFIRPGESFKYHYRVPMSNKKLAFFHINNEGRPPGLYDADGNYKGGLALDQINKDYIICSIYNLPDSQNYHGLRCDHQVKPKMEIKRETVNPVKALCIRNWGPNPPAQFEQLCNSD